MARHTYDKGKAKALRLQLHLLAERTLAPKQKIRGSYIPAMKVAQCISDWMDGDTLEEVAERYHIHARTVLQWTSGENRANILFQVEQARRKAGLPIRYTHGVDPHDKPRKERNDRRALATDQASGS